MSSIAVEVDQLSKKYQLGEVLERHRTLRDAVAGRINASKRWLKRIGSPPGSGPNCETLWALRNVSFELRKGEVLGIVGRNGSGKSTLLKILSRVTEPTEGSVTIYGRVNSLLEVGTGFHSELTGRENVYLNGAILGMRRADIERKFDEIIAFADVEKFVDTPVKHYSSGMFVRLAFAVAAHMEPDILIVDEVLAVGDAAFQQKCLDKIKSFARQGRTVLFVSHNLSLLSRLCARAILLRNGRLQLDGPLEKVIETYLFSRLQVTGTWSRPADDSNAKPVLLLAARTLNSSGAPSASVEFREGFQMEITYRVNQAMSDWWVLFRVLGTAGQAVFTSWDIDSLPCIKMDSPGIYTAVCTVPGYLLKPGVYGATLAVVRKNTTIDSYEGALRFEISPVGYPLNEDRMGAITPILKWRAERVNEPYYHT